MEDRKTYKLKVFLNESEGCDKYVRNKKNDFTMSCICLLCFLICSESNTGYGRPKYYSGNGFVKGQMGMMETREYLDIADESGKPTGEIISRDEAHSRGILHRTAHVWVVRKTDKGYDILLQKRSEEKESFPGLYDTSSAGHIPAGEEPLESALRELSEELGIEASEEDLHYAGSFRIRYEKEFHGKMFRDNELANVFVYDLPVDIGTLILQETEVSEVKWFDLDGVWNEIKNDRSRFCVPTGGLNILREYLR